ncbi:MAG: excinuclease ABC subunit UvrB [bacterium]|nr:excinuclease ABC subunit UvrB [bacterium]
MFTLESKFKPTGDQPEAIEKIVNNIKAGVKEQVLMGVTGSGKTFTMANVIKSVDKPTLVLAHNKTLAGQLYSEFKEFFPNDRVEYFISYYDYFQPEAYVVSSDTYIEKDASINDEIDEMRHGATESLLEHRNTIVVASVSCIYGIGDPEDYKASMLVLRVGQKINKKEILNKLVEMQYKRNDIDFSRSTFRVRGDIIDIIQPNEHSLGIKIELFDEEIESIKNFDVTTGKSIMKKDIAVLFPATHFMTNKEKMEETIRRIESELEERIKYFKDNDKLLEAQRIEQRTRYDIEMLKEIGSCSGVENYARHLALRGEGETPSTLIDFFPKDFLLIVDESHVTLPQVRGMFNGDRSRKQTLVDYGFRLPSALDNRPLRIEEFMSKLNQVLYVSATPGDYELSHNFPITEQIIRPTGLLDPVIEVREELGQIDDLISEIEKRKMANERVLVTTLTIKMSEDLTTYLRKRGYKVAYLHSEIKSLERIQIIRDLRIGTYDVLVGINLLREGLDIPEVSLVAILDADKQGFLRSSRSLVQTIGRAARNEHGKVIMYANTISDSMEYAIKETNRRREIQEAYNKKNNIIPKTIIKAVPEVITIKKKLDDEAKLDIKELEKEMYKAADELDFERAARLRDIILELKAKKSGKSI